MLYAMQIDEHSLRIFSAVARDIVTLDVDGNLTHDIWPPKEAVPLERKPEKDEVLKIVKGKHVFIKREIPEPGPSIEDRLKALEDKQ